MATLESIPKGDPSHTSPLGTFTDGVRAQDGGRIVSRTLPGDRRAEALARLGDDSRLSIEFGASVALQPLALVDDEDVPRLVLDPAGLEALCRRGGTRLDAAEVIRLGLAVSRVLARMHARGFVHGALCPEAIWVDATLAEARLSVFDLCFTDAGPVLRPPQPQRPHDLRYLAPELSSPGRPADRRADLYALGVVLYEALTGRVPFALAGAVAIHHAHSAVESEPAGHGRPDIPASLSRVVAVLLAKDPDERYQGATGLARDLGAIARELEDPGSPAPDLDGVRLRDAPVRPDTLFGREREFAALRDFFLPEGRGAFGLVRGSSGLGKSAVVDHAIRSLDARRIVGAGKCDQLRHHEPFAALRTSLESVLRRIDEDDGNCRDEFASAAREALEGTGAALHAILPAIGRHVPAPEFATSLSGHAEEVRLRSAFHGLFRALGSLSRPVGIVLDDLQWADPASVSLLQSFASMPDPPPVTMLFLVRDDEIGPGSALSAAVDAMTNHACLGLDLSLGPLDADDIEGVVAHALGADRDEIRPLADAILGHSQGNAMFVVEELQELWRSGALHRDAESGRWTWSSADLRAVAHSHKLSELMSSRVARLPPESGVLLAHAACFGRTFAPAALAVVARLGRDEVQRRLGPALRDGLLVAVRDDEDRERWHFAHDQIQAAAYESLAAAEREVVHLRVGSMLLGREDDTDDRVPEAIGHLNSAAALLTRDGRARWLAGRNLVAARLFVPKAAFAEAYSCLKTAVGLLDDSAWSEDPELARDIHLDAARIACVASDAAAALPLVEALRRHARSGAEEVAALEIAVEAYKILDRFEDAIRTGRVALEKLGVRLPTGARAIPRLVATHVRILRLGAPALARLRPMRDSRTGAAMRILAELGTPSFLVMPALFLSIVEAQLRLSLDFGNAPESAYAYALYGVILAGPLRQITRGYDAGRAALEVLESADRAQTPRTLMPAYIFVMPWKLALPACLDVYLDGSRTALEVGDPEFANYLACGYAAYSTHAGATLAEAVGKLDRLRTRILPLGQQRQYAADIYHQMMLNLLSGDGDPALLTGPVYDELVHGAAHAGAKEMNAHLHLVRLMLAVLFDRPEELAKHLDGFWASAEPFAGMYCRAAFFFYEALALLRYDRGPRARFRAATTLLRLKRWAGHCPANFRHKVRLLQAEMARAGGNATRALALYEEAAAGAEREGFHLEAGLALEGAACAANERGMAALSRHFVHEARRVYGAWGAEAKLRDLEIRFGADAAPGTTAPDGESRPGWGLAPASLDLVGVLEASQALSEGMDLDATVLKIMRTVVSVSGAQGGALLVDHEDRLSVIAVAQTRGDKLDVRVFADAGSPWSEASCFAVGVVDEVRRSGQPLILSAPEDDPRFRGDPHLVARKPRSLLCCPIQHGNKRQAIVYLEHQLRRDAFGARQLETVRLLSTQAAISLDNARLYARQLRLSAGAQRFVPEEFLRLLGKQDVDEVALSDHVEAEMTILVCDIRGFTSTTETMTPEASFAYINEFFALVGPAVREHRGFIIKYMGDGFMALFPAGADDAAETALAIPGLLHSMSSLRVGIGLHTGAVSVGAVGERSRIQGDVMSDVANVACRLESLTREHGVAAVLSAQTHERLSPALRGRTSPLGHVPVKGRTGTIDIFSLA